ncbi:hypothetical protein [Falsiroseomonas sp. E2-1-a20]|uniref:hypothetical protein n=1 Tax=Falsiroseomonas sp. E2-1-a20 TaxID=3239300 RepID=UPI003F2D5E42
MTPASIRLRDLLEAAAEARRRGDRGAAEMLETDAVMLLRDLMPARQEARA